MGISAGLTLHKPNFPLYQIAEQSGQAESAAKSAWMTCNNCDDTAKRLSQSEVDACPMRERIDGVNLCSKRKGKMALFYSSQLAIKAQNVKKRYKEEDKKTGVVRTGNKITVLPIGYRAMGAFIKQLVILSRRIESDGDSQLERLSPDVLSRGTIYKLFAIANRWQQEGQMYLPSLAYLNGNVARRLRGLDKEKAAAFGDIISKLMEAGLVEHTSELNPRNNALHPVNWMELPLTWIEELYRTKGDIYERE